MQGGIISLQKERDYTASVTEEDANLVFSVCT